MGISIQKETAVEHKAVAKKIKQRPVTDKNSWWTIHTRMDASRSLLLKILRLLSGSINEEIRMFSMLSDASPFTDLRKHSSAQVQASSPKRHSRRVSRPVLKNNYSVMKTVPCSEDQSPCSEERTLFWRPTALFRRPTPLL